MPDSAGTRNQALTRQQHCDQGHESRKHTRDVLMSKRVVTTATFTASDGKVTGSNGDFTAFAVNDQILVAGTNLNDGFKTVTAIDGTNHAFLVLDPAPKNESSVASTEIRAA